MVNKLKWFSIRPIIFNMVINFRVSAKNEMRRTCSMHENREENLIFDFNIDCNRTFLGRRSRRKSNIGKNLKNKMYGCGWI